MLLQCCLCPGEPTPGPADATCEDLFPRGDGRLDSDRLEDHRIGSEECRLDGSGPRNDAKGERCCRPSVVVGLRVLHREPAPEPAIAFNHGKGDGDARNAVPVLVQHLHHQGILERRAGRSLLSVARDLHELMGTGPLPPGSIPHLDPLRCSGGESSAVG